MGVFGSHSYAQPTRFLPPAVLGRFERVELKSAVPAVEGSAEGGIAVDIRNKIASLWV